MQDTSMSDQPFEVHDPDILAQARGVLNACQSGKAMQDAVLAAVKRNEQWRGEQCINLLAPEAPTSPAVRALLSAEVGIRAAEGHIGKVNRWFAGTMYIDEIEALCVELLKRVFRARYADHRLVASMIGNLTAYTALTEPGDVIMSIAQPFGGHSSNRSDGPEGVRGLKIVDVPMDPTELVVDLDVFRKTAPLVRPKLVALGASLTLFPFPLQEMSAIVAEWGGKLFFDGAHQIGLIAGGQFQDPLREGAVVMTGSAGKTFSGPQSGIIVWDDPSLTPSLTHAIFPVLAATHQVNRVAALAVAAAEMIEFRQPYMAQIVRNAQALGAALEQRGIPVFGAHKGYTRTHQVLADVRAFGGGLDVAHLLARANIVTNKNLLLTDIKDIVEQPSAVTLDHTVKEEYEVAPAVRQIEIYKFLISTALSNKHPDIVRQNCYISLGVLASLTKDQVKIEVSQFYSDKVKRNGLDVFTTRVSFAAGILPYFKKSILKTFYSSYLDHMKAIGHDFRSNDKHGNLLREFREIGGLECCHDEVVPGMIEWLCQCYIGEQSFGQYSASRQVFYSNVGAPLAKEILLDSKHKVTSLLEVVIAGSKAIQRDCKWQYCQTMAQDLIDALAQV